MSAKVSKFARTALAAAIAISGTVATTALATSTAHATTTSVTNGQISRSEILARAQYWYNQRANIPYSQGGNYPDQQGASYRTDCSGFVSMAWHLSAPGLSTKGLPGVSHEINRSDLRPGDVLNDYEDHVILFEKWQDAAHTVFDYYSFGSTPVKHVLGVSINAPYFDSHPNSLYKALRYDNVVEDAAASNVQLGIVGADGAQYSQYGNYASGSFNSSWT
ncbi:hypothetical protein ABZ449_27535, partial [Kitasatospora sp. NPDC005856]